MTLLQTEINFDPVKALLSWYGTARRELPWRAKPHERPDPYHVWLSEVMLQQTMVATVMPRYIKFLERWPDIEALARVPLDDVLHEWQGLGYYARARNLHRCAQVVVAEHGGVFPDNEAALLKLPGIGDYTAAAIVAIAFNQPSAPVDGNIIRVISRLDGLKQIMPAGKSIVKDRVQVLMPIDHSGDFTQAMMDLGSMVCSPRNPDCDQCPWASGCVACASGSPESYPKKQQKKQKPTRYGIVFWLTDNRDHVLLRRREKKGLLGGMMEFPSTPWREQHWAQSEAMSHAPVEGVSWHAHSGSVRHTFTHFHLELTVVRGSFDGMSNAIWSLPADFGDYALPTLMKKVAKLIEDFRANL